MTTDLRERLDDLLAGVPSHVHADASTAWRAGARRRVRRRVVAGGAVLAALALVGAAGLTTHRLTEAPPADGGDGSRPSASTYPARIDAPLLTMGTLPDHPGPIAGLLKRNQGWFVVGQRGQVWRIDGARDFDWNSAISPDGTRIAYVDTSGGQSGLELLDLVNGGAFDPDIGGSGKRHPWLIDGPMYWSPDSSRLFVPVRPGKTYRGPGVEALVVTPDSGSAAVVAPGGSDVEPLGWLSPDRLGWLRWTHDELHPDVLITGVRGGRVLQSAPAPGRIPRNWFVNAVSLPSTSGLTQAIEVSTVTRQLLISWPGKAGDSMLVANRPIGDEQTLACPPSWGDSYPFVPYQPAPDGFLLWTGPRSYAVQVAPALGPVSCSVWAFDALRGGEHHGLGGHLFGERDTWLSWHWRQVGLGVAIGAFVLGVGLALWWRRRRGARLTT